MNVVMLGIPGAGKGTQSKQLTSRRGLRHISTGDLLRAARQQDTPLGRQIAQRIDAGDFVTDDLAMSLVEQAMAPPPRHGCVFDGIPRTARQDQMLSDLLARDGAKIDLVIQLEVAESTVRNRLLKRAELERRSDDTLEIIDHRLVIYETETAPLVDRYRDRGILRSIDGSGTPDEVFESIVLTLDHGMPGDAPLTAN